MLRLEQTRKTPLGPPPLILNRPGIKSGRHQDKLSHREMGTLRPIKYRAWSVTFDSWRALFLVLEGKSPRYRRLP